MLSIPNYPPSRQGKSLGCEWVSVLDVVVFKAPHRPFKRQTRLEGHHILELANKVALPMSSKMPELFEKSPFQELKNTLISR
jgi:hypothetical protein